MILIGLLIGAFLLFGSTKPATSQADAPGTFMRNLVITLVIALGGFFILAGGIVASIPDGNGGHTYVQSDVLTPINSEYEESWCDWRTEAGQAARNDPNYVAAYCGSGESLPKSWLDEPIYSIQPVVVELPTEIPIVRTP